jgi:transcription initiation factor IIE alpha subunit
MNPAGTCPKCNEKLDYLICRVTEYKYIYAGDYDPIAVSEPIETVFVCPECGAILAASEGEANVILGLPTSQGTGSKKRPPREGKGEVERTQSKPAL